ncbi:MAG: DUF5658 family protein [Nitrococcus sp.]|nr:DUF5658 family protein [Nitrococcus sp.]
MSGASLTNARRGVERRERPLWGSRHFWLGGRRYGPRRADDNLRRYTDVYGPGVTTYVVIIMSACALDALLTLYLLDNGAVEANPLMAGALTLGVGEFVRLKLVITGIGLLLLAIHHRFVLWRWLRVYQAMTCLAAGYVVLLIYELGLSQLSQ